MHYAVSCHIFIHCYSFMMSIYKINYRKCMVSNNKKPKGLNARQRVCHIPCRDSMDNYIKYRNRLNFVQVGPIWLHLWPWAFNQWPSAIYQMIVVSIPAIFKYNAYTIRFIVYQIINTLGISLYLWPKITLTFESMTFGYISKWLLGQYLHVLIHAYTKGFYSFPNN